MIQSQVQPSQVSVQQELLLALLGHTGDVFVDISGKASSSTYVREPRASLYKLGPDVDWIDGPERESLNGLIKLGYHFNALESFVEAERRPVSTKEGSAYRRALGTGISELLDVYRAAILQVQQQLRSNAAPPLSALYYYLDEFQVLLPALHQVVYEVQQKSLMGPSILHLLDLKAQCGIPELQSCVSRLWWHCNQVLFKNLAAWMVHGHLIDRHGEFLVQRTQQANELDAFDGAGPLEASDSKAQEWHAAFQVSVAALPPHVTLATAESVLFIGKAVRVLRQGGPQSGDGLDPRGESSRPEADTRNVAASLSRMQRADKFHPLEFEQTVETIRAQVAGHLWQLLVVRADLPAHLTALKDYFLLARGDFFRTFLVESHSLMALPPRLATVEGDIAIPFQQSALKSSAEGDRLFSRVRILFMPPSSPRRAGPSSQETPSGGRNLYVPHLDKWDDLGLEYRVDWPLHLLFTAEVMSKYNLLFQYLLRLKRVGLGLEEAWGVLRRGQGSATGNGAAPLWHVRHHMAHMINNLQIYVQVDVIEAQFALLMRRVAGACDFKEVERAHRAYLDALLSQSFLDMRQIAQMLEAVFTLCQRLCTYVQQEAAAADGGEWEAVPADKCATMASDFRRRAGLLYTLLQSNRLQSSQRAPYLRQLLLRLNFNSYVEREARQLLRNEAGHVPK